MDLEALVLHMVCMHFVDLIFWNLLGILVDIDSELLFSTSITSTDIVSDVAYDYCVDMAARNGHGWWGRPPRYGLYVLRRYSVQVPARDLGLHL